MVRTVTYNKGKRAFSGRKKRIGTLDNLFSKIYSDKSTGKVTKKGKKNLPPNKAVNEREKKAIRRALKEIRDPKNDDSQKNQTRKKRNNRKKPEKLTIEDLDKQMTAFQ